MSTNILIRMDNISKIEVKKLKSKNCWFCDKKCYYFISICESCKTDRYLNKKLKKN